MSLNKIALVGATGNLGPAILKALLNAGYEVTILSREGSTSTDSLASHPNQKVAKVNFEDVNSITAALEGIEGVVSNVASHALLSQKKIIDAAINAGVKRFLPSDFGSDLSVEANKSVPFNMPKTEIHEYLEGKAKNHPDFSYTFVTNGPFFDWCLAVGLFGDLKAHDMTLWDGGETKVSTTTLPSVGKAVAGVFKNLEATKNKEIRIADTTITQKQIIEIVKEIDGKEWTTKTSSTAEAYQLGLDEFKKPEPNFQLAVFNQLFRIIFSDEHGTNMEGKLDNDKVGLSIMTEEQVKEVVKNSLA
jgi:putative NADH-flavin reductase